VQQLAGAGGEPALRFGGAVHRDQPGESESDIAGAFASVKDGDTLAFAAGTYAFDNQLALGAATA
jgi:hypothetical protein